MRSRADRTIDELFHSPLAKSPPEADKPIAGIADLVALIEGNEPTDALRALLRTSVRVRHKVLALTIGSGIDTKRAHDLIVAHLENGKCVAMPGKDADYSRRRAGKLPTPDEARAYRVIRAVVPRLLERICNRAHRERWQAENPRRLNSSDLNDPDVQWDILWEFAKGKRAAAVAEELARMHSLSMFGLKFHKYSARHLLKVHKMLLRELAAELSR
jgi:hypothetical protein